MKLLPIAMLLVLFSCTAFANDTLRKPIVPYKVNKMLCLRSDVGWNRSWFGSLGVSYLYNNINSHMPVSLLGYAAMEANVGTYRKRTDVFYAYKAGIEFAGWSGLALEWRHYTDFAGTDHDVFTPKYFFSVFGIVNLGYGVNVYKKVNNVFGIGRHQVSLSINFSPRMLRENMTPTK